MNPIIKQLAEDAGFCFWTDEDWAPPGAIIDWSAQYDKEFNKYTEYLIVHLTQRLLESRLINIPMACQIYEDYGIKDE